MLIAATLTLGEAVPPAGGDGSDLASRTLAYALAIAAIMMAAFLTGVYKKLQRMGEAVGQPTTPRTGPAAVSDLSTTLTQQSATTVTQLGTIASTLVLMRTEISASRQMMEDQIADLVNVTNTNTLTIQAQGLVLAEHAEELALHKTLIDEAHALLDAPHLQPPTD